MNDSDNFLNQEQKRIKYCLVKHASARIRNLITYSELCTEAKLPYSMENAYHRNLLSEDLGVVAEIEVNYGRPMITCLVVEKYTSYPAKGFYDWAEEIYGIRLSNKEARDFFFFEELKATIDYWTSEEAKNYIRDFEQLIITD